MDYLDKTKESIEDMLSFLSDNTKQKADVVGLLADMKIALDKEETRLKQDLAASELAKITLEDNLAKSRTDNIALLDRIGNQNKTPEVLKNDEQSKQAEKASKKAARLVELAQQFGSDYAKEAIEWENF